MVASLMTPKQCILGLTLTAASLAVPAAEQGLSPLVAPGQDSSPAPWHVSGLPRQNKPFTRFSVVERSGGSHALRIEAERSYGNLVHPLSGVSASQHLAWRWQVEQPMQNADLRQRSGEDMAVRVCAMFDLPDDRIPFGERTRLYFARVNSSDPVPGATVCYVWDSKLEPGTVVESPFTRRIRFMVLRGPESPLQEWRSERRDLAADFQRLFGDESPQVPPLIGVLVGADADNTGGHSVAYVSDLTLAP
jgi:hypothetical protein